MFTLSRTSRRMFPVACAALAMIAAIGFLHHARPAAAATSSPAQTAPTSDHALLMQLSAKVDADRAVIASLRSQVAAQQSKLNALSAVASHADSAAAHANAALAAVHPDASTYGPFTVSGKNVYLTDYNLHIQSGSGSTGGKVNGYGNLIIGYNETRGSSSQDNHTGSHNLIIGSENNYSGYGAIIGGFYNTSSAAYASVTGGRHGTASGNYSSVTGGYGGAASGQYASVTGGDANAANGEYSSVSAGEMNAASGDYASVTGGYSNTASGDASCVTCGAFNQATYEYASDTGGYGNVSSGYASTLSGGANETEGNDYYWRGGTYESAY